MAGRCLPCSSPWPSWPLSFQPRAYSAPAMSRTSVCARPAAACKQQLRCLEMQLHWLDQALFSWLPGRPSLHSVTLFEA